MFDSNCRARERIATNSAASMSCCSRSSNSPRNSSWVSTISAETASSSAGVAATVRRGAAATSWPLSSVTRKAVTIRGRLSSLTRSWAPSMLLNDTQLTAMAGDGQGDEDSDRDVHLRGDPQGEVQQDAQPIPQHAGTSTGSVDRLTAREQSRRGTVLTSSRSTT